MRVRPQLRRRERAVSGPGLVLEDPCARLDCARPAEGAIASAWVASARLCAEHGRAFAGVYPGLVAFVRDGHPAVLPAPPAGIARLEASEPVDDPAPVDEPAPDDERPKLRAARWAVVNANDVVVLVYADPVTARVMARAADGWQVRPLVLADLDDVEEVTA